MTKKQHFVGIDIASETFYAAIFIAPDCDVPSKEFENSLDGFNNFILWMTEHKVNCKTALVCMEATGVYCDRLCYFLSSNDFDVVVEAPHKVKRAFTKLVKSDSVDSRQIAEYAYRFKDELQLFIPKSEIVEHISALLTTREQLMNHKTANQNALKALKRKHISTPTAIKVLNKSIKDHEKQIQIIEKEMEHLIKKDKDLHQMMLLVFTIPSIKHFMFYNLLVHTEGFTREINPRHLASYFGIAPLEYSSGSSVYKRPKSKRKGPSGVRKLLYLASMSISTHNAEFRKYYLRKVAEGKPKRLVLNNIENKILKVLCAVINNKEPFISNYKSVNPILLK